MASHFQTSVSRGRLVENSIQFNAIFNPTSRFLTYYFIETICMRKKGFANGSQWFVVFSNGRTHFARVVADWFLGRAVRDRLER